MGGRSEPLDIKPIDKAVIHRICSGQVILDLPSAVKELVENSLDAGASSIEINLKEFGEESFKVTDNGCGILPSNFQVIALKHHTSKISEFSDLQSLATFGFRGEALSSLCALGNLSIETRTKNDSIGTKLTFDHSGVVTTETKTARQVGTTVTIEKLFATLPVRCKEFSRNIRREYGKLISLLNAYVIIARGVRILCTNTTSKNVKSLVLKTEGSSLLKDNIITVFGLSTFQGLEPLDLSLLEGCKVEGFLSKPGYGNGRNTGDRQYFYVNGRPVDMPKISKLLNELYRSANSKQFPVAILNFVIPSMSFDVNVTPDKRKFFFPDEGRLILSFRSEIGKLYCPNQCSYSLNLTEEPEKIEEPEKEPEFCHSNFKNDAKDEDSLTATKEFLSSECVHSLKSSSNQKHEGSRKMLHLAQDLIEEKEFISDISPSTESHMVKSESFSSYNYKQSKDFMKPKIEVEGKGKSVSHSRSVQSSLTNFVVLNKRKHENSCDVLSEAPVLRNESSSWKVKKISLDSHASASDHSDPEPHDLLADGSLKTSTGEVLEHIKHSVSNSVECEVHQKLSEEGLNVISDDSSYLVSSSVTHHEKYDTLKPCSGSKAYSILQFKMNDLRRKNQWKLRKFQSITLLHDKKALAIASLSSYTAASVGNSQPENEEGKSECMAAAAIELDRVFRKEYFRQMEVIGQFNLGFIIGKLNQDLFIIDQHAADEKHNFEQLSRSTILNRQPLLRRLSEERRLWYPHTRKCSSKAYCVLASEAYWPMRLNLSPEEEVIASMHLQTIRKNGFVLTEDVQAQTGHRFLLKSVPFSKNITFGAEDVKELISMLGDDQDEYTKVSSHMLDTTDSLCPSRFRAMLASRACHASVMIGDPLTKTEMQKILRNLAHLNSPWNCPHGRPTMRHLADLNSIQIARSRTGFYKTSLTQ